MQRELDEFEVKERYLILLLGVVDKPIPSREHLQKELFILSKAHPKASEFLKFEKHYKGPFSSDVSELIENPSYYVGAFSIDKSGRCSLTKEGRRIYEEIVQENQEDARFKELLAIIKTIRELYDRLSKDELLFLIYTSYPEYREKSIYFDKLLSKKRALAESLLKKGLITEKRFVELASYNNSSKQ
jgi:hypothetical protein